jgi:hypothetical protein
MWTLWAIAAAAVAALHWSNYAAVSAREKGRAALSWPTVPATLLHHEIAEHSFRRSRNLHELKLRYEYFAGGQRQVGTRVSFAGNTRYRSETDALLAAARFKKSMQARVSPENPAESVIELVYVGESVFWFDRFWLDHFSKLTLAAGVLLGLLAVAMIVWHDRVVAFASRPAKPEPKGDYPLFRG